MKKKGITPLHPLLPLLPKKCLNATTPNLIFKLIKLTPSANEKCSNI